MKLLDQVRHTIRKKHYSIRTEQAYIKWIRAYILFNGKRHPLEMGESEINAFLSSLASSRHVSASTQNQVLMIASQHSAISDKLVMKNFRELKVWEKSHILTLKIYQKTAKFPKEEQYGLTSQLRRACASIPTNIAEGCGRGRDTELKRFSEIALGSAMEVDYLLQLANDLDFLKQHEYEILLDDVIEVKKMLTSFIQKLKADC